MCVWDQPACSPGSAGTERPRSIQLPGPLNEINAAQQAPKSWCHAIIYCPESPSHISPRKSLSTFPPSALQHTIKSQVLLPDENGSMNNAGTTLHQFRVCEEVMGLWSCHPEEQPAPSVSSSVPTLLSGSPPPALVTASLGCHSVPCLLSSHC